jgi:hypothetical protein
MGMARPESTLVTTLLHTRGLLELMIARLEAEVELSVSDEQRLRRGRRAVRRITGEYLPWARSPALTQEQHAEFLAWVYRTRRQLSLDTSEEG